MDLLSRSDIISHVHFQADYGVNNALEAMLRVAAAEYPGIQWQARHLAANNQGQASRQSMEAANSKDLHTSFGCKLDAGVGMAARLKRSCQLHATTEVTANYLVVNNTYLHFACIEPEVKCGDCRPRQLEVTLPAQYNEVNMQCTGIRGGDTLQFRMSCRLEITNEHRSTPACSCNDPTSYVPDYIWLLDERLLAADDCRCTMQTLAM